LSDFVFDPQSGAEDHVERTDVMRLSIEDQRAFVEAILDPPEPSLSLRRAFERHRLLIDESR